MNDDDTQRPRDADTHDDSHTRDDPHAGQTHDDFLWDGSGPPDPEVQALQRALAPARYRPGRAVALPPARRRVTSPLAAALIAATLLVTALGLWSAWGDAADVPASGDGHGDVASGTPAHDPASTPAPGAPRDGTAPADTAAYRAEALSGALELSELRAGDRLVTDAATRARLTIGGIGSVVVEPETQLRVESAEGAADPDAEHLLYLERGTLTASIFAAPRLFQVGTPSGIAVDLGCVYTARVDDDGGTLLSVLTGQVAFEADERRVTVPSGASTRARPGSGPGTPVWDDAPAPWRAALERVDELAARREPEAGLAAKLASALDSVLATERREDSLPLWHLASWSRLPEAERARVVERLAVLVPPPEGVTAQACLALDAEALTAWREEFAWGW
jgi:hypothetical protein